MIYTDKEITEKGSNIIIEGFDRENINPVSYDLTVGAIVGEDGEVKTYDLKHCRVVCYNHLVHNDCHTDRSISSHIVL